MATYTRQSSFSDGDTITAALLNNEYDQLLSAFHVSSGHTHDGSTTGDGGPLSTLYSNALTFGTNADTDIVITFNANSNDGVLTWMEDEDYFKFSDDILINSTERLNFQDTGTYIYSSTDGQLDLVADTEIQIAATTIDINGAVAMDGAITGATNITLSGELDAATLDISGDADIDGTLEADAITINGTAIGSLYGAVAGSSSIVTTGALNSGSITSGFGTIDTGSSAITTTGTVTYGSLSDGSITVTAFVDEDNMSSDSATLIPTQQSVKAYVDSQIATEDTLAELNDTNITSPGDAALLIYDTGTSTWRDYVVSGDITISDAGVAAIASDVIVNADINTSAAIADSKLATISTAGKVDIGALEIDGASEMGAGLADADLFIVDDGAGGTEKSMLASRLPTYLFAKVSGDITVNSSGVGAIASDVIVNADINSSAAIADSKLATISTADKVAGGAIQIDSGTDGTSITLADTDKFLVDDGGTTKYINASQINTYTSASVLADDIGTGDAAVTLATSTGNITVDAQGDDTDIIFKGTDGTVDTTFLTIDGSEAGAATFNNKIVATELDISGDVDIDGTLETDALTINGTTLSETIADTVGAMVTSNTESGITVAYDDADNTLDFTVGTLNQNTTGTAATVTTAAQSNITSLGTLTTLTVDNVIINGSTIGHTGDTDLITVASGIATVAGEVSMTTLDIGGTNVTSTAAELNILDGVTATAAELNILDGVTATAAELNLLDGGTAVGSSITIADADGFVVNDGGTMKTIPASDISTYTGGGAALTGSTNNTVTTVTGVNALQGEANLTFDGTTLAVAGTVEPSGDTASGDNAAIGYTATEGLILTGQGSTSDVTIKNDADATVISIPTGTTLVGIGTTAPDRELTVGGVANARIGILSNDNSVGACQLHFGDADNSQIGRIMYEHDGNKMTFHTNNSEAIRIDSSGNVGIGATSVLSPLHVASATADADGALGSQSPQMILQGGTGNQNNRFEFGMDNSGGTAIGFLQSRNTSSGVQHLSLNPKGGNVGIGEDSPGTLLDIKGAAGVNHRITFNSSDAGSNGDVLGGFVAENQGDSVGQVTVRRESAGDDGQIQFETQATGGSLTEKMRIVSSGNVLFSTTSSPDTVIGASGSGMAYEADGFLGIARTGATCLFLNRRTDDGAILDFREDGTTVGIISSKDKNSIIIGEGDAGIRFYGGGSVIVPHTVAGGSSDNALTFGYTGNRWSTIYAGTGTINTSDENEKQSIQSLTTTEMKVAKKVSSLIKTFKFNDAVEKKGENARTHTGIIAQDIQQAFNDEGLDASKYAFWCSDTWWEKEISVEATEEKDAYTDIDIKYEATTGYTEKTRLGLRYSELFSFIQAYNDQRFTELEARITTLEANNP